MDPLQIAGEQAAAAPRFVLPPKPEFLLFAARGLAVRLDAIETVEPGRPARGLVTIQLKRPITTYQEFREEGSVNPSPPYPVKQGAVVLVLKDAEAQAVTALYFGGLPWGYPGYNGVVFDVLAWGKAVTLAAQQAQESEEQRTKDWSEPAPPVVSAATRSTGENERAIPRLKI